MKSAGDGKEHAERGELQDTSGEERAWSRRLLEPTGDPLWRLLAVPSAPALEGQVEDGQVEAELALGNGSMWMRAVFPLAAPCGTSLGVHSAIRGGVWQAAVLGFAGLSSRPDGLRLDPHLPPR